MGVIGTFREIEYESYEEYKFLVWTFQLIDHFQLDASDVRIKRGESYELSPKVKIGKTTVREHSYKPEFVVWFGRKNKLLEIFEKQFETKSPRCYWIEVKPEFDQNNMTRLFRLNQKWMLLSLGIFTNLVVPSKLFEKTFTPNEFIFNKKGGPRKLKYTPTKLLDYVTTI